MSLGHYARYMTTQQARFWSQTIAFLIGCSVARYIHSLAPITLLTRSTALHFATLASLARFTPLLHGLVHSHSSLPCWMVDISEFVFTP